MREQIKSSILIILVILSILMTGNLWLGTHQYDWTSEPNIEKITYGEPPEVLKQSRPNNIIYQPKDNYNKYLLPVDSEEYYRLWEALHENIFSDNNVINNIIPVDKHEIETSSDKLIYNFNTSIKSILDQGTSNFINEEDIDGLTQIIVLNSDKPQIYFTSPDSTHYYQVKSQYDNFNIDSLIDELNMANLYQANRLSLSMLEEILIKFGVELTDENYQQIDLPNIYLSDYPDELAVKRLYFEELEQEKLAKAFFLDLSFIRKIEERDGTNIYTDGQRGLRFYPDGAVEYNAPNKEGEFREKQDYQTILTNSGRYISLYGGWCENLIVSEIVPYKEQPYRPYIDKYSINYQTYHRGLPIVNNYFLELEIASQGLKKFYRKIPKEYEKITEDTEVIPWQTALEEWLSYELDENRQDYELIETINNLTDIKLGYYQTETEGLSYITPVWVFQFEELDNVMINALSGNNISKEEGS